MCVCQCEICAVINCDELKCGDVDGSDGGDGCSDGSGHIQRLLAPSHCAKLLHTEVKWVIASNKEKHIFTLHVGERNEV